jgi:LysM repeat protein
VPLALDKQRRLCLTDAHRACPAFLAGVELRERRGGPHAAELGLDAAVGLANADAAATASVSAPDAPGAADDGQASGTTRRGPRRPVPSTTPVLLERSRSAVPGALSLPSASRTSGQVILIALLVVAFVAIALARFGSSGTGVPSASPAASGSPLASASSVLASASPSVAPTDSPTSVASPTGSVVPTPSPTPKPTPTVRPTKPPATPRPTPSVGTRTYTVKSGDTLSSIAAHFGVSVASIQALNGIQDPRLIHPGEVLQIP